MTLWCALRSLQSEPDPEEGVDLLEGGEPGAGAGAAKRADGEATAAEGGGRLRNLRGLLPKMQLPSMQVHLAPHLANMKIANPFSKKKKERDVEAGPTVTSEENGEPESTPMQETKEEAEKIGEKAKEAEAMKDQQSKEDDGMETVQLDADV